MDQFRCYHCGGNAFRALKQPDTVECLQCGRSSRYKPTQSVFATTIEITVGGQDYSGAYTVEGTTVTVRSGCGVKTAQLVDVASSAKTLARLLLAEIISEQRRADTE